MSIPEGIPRPDAVTLHNGKMYLNHQNKTAIMECIQSGRHIKVVINYQNQDFTENQARSDFNKTLRKLSHLGQENMKKVYAPADNIKVYFDAIVEPWEADTNITEIKRGGKKVQITEGTDPKEGRQRR